MKKTRFAALLAACALVLGMAPGLVSCSDDDDSDSTPELDRQQLDTPTNIRLDESSRTLHWDAVPHAASYTIKRPIPMEGFTTVTANSYRLEEYECDRWNTYEIVANPAASSVQYESSESASFKFVCPVNKQLLPTPDRDSFVGEDLGDTEDGTKALIRLSWGAVEGASRYGYEVIPVSDAGGKRYVSDTSEAFLECKLLRGCTYQVKLSAIAPGYSNFLQSEDLVVSYTVPAK